ncbi:MAG: hypothetical protein ACFFCW_30555, partial [Candidatus Hodarchaeota archaeon]
MEPPAVCDMLTDDCAILICSHHPETGGRRTIACATPYAFLPQDGSPYILTPGHLVDVCSLSSRANFEPVSAPLQGSIRVFHPLNPAPPTVRLAVHLPPSFVRRGYEVSTFHINDPLNTVGASWTPVVQRFRASTLTTDNLTIHSSHRGRVFDLVHLVGLSRFTMRTDIHMCSPEYSSLALNRGGVPEGSSCRHSDPIRYVVRGASHPVISATAARPR